MSFDRVQLDTNNREAGDPATEAKPAFVVRGMATEVNAHNSPAFPTAAPSQTKRGSNMKKVSFPVFAALAVVVIVGGGLTGFLLRKVVPASGGSLKSAATSVPAAAIADQIKVGAVFGVPDEKTFKDSTEGILIKGGLNGEGSHTLLREGGISQNVYLTSSVVDLDRFVDTSVKVWGETFKGQKAGWLMDVGRLEVKSLTATKPAWYAAQQAKTSATPAAKTAPQGE
jgi:hypothetical protein